MTFFECIKMAFSSMRMNKMRSFLTMLGIIIGISSVITISTIGTTLKKTVSDSVLGTGATTIDLHVILKDNNSNYTRITKKDMITEDMINGLMEKYPGDYELVTYNFLSEGEVITENNDAYVLRIAGIQQGYMSYSMQKVIKGRNISSRDVSEKKHTALVSEVFEKQYSPNESIIGKTISLSGNYNFQVTVVGVYGDKKTLQQYELGQKDITTFIYIPYTVSAQLKGTPSEVYGFVELKPNPEKNPDILTKQAQSFFDKIYERNEHAKVHALNYGEVTKIYLTVIDILAVAFSLIAAISLIVGGVGVMNIMLVSVVERTSEIGIRKALGAKTKSIKRQFITEAVIICLIGGSIGIGTGLGGSYLLGAIAKYLLNAFAPDVAESINIVTPPSVLAIIISVLCSILIGVIFGSSPAKRAAKMNPIDALRFE